jgi:hypothetical protein
MTRYFFDLVDGKQIDRDDVGLEFANLADARVAAADALGDVTREALPDGARRHLVMKVRDTAGNYIYECSVDFSAGVARSLE